MLRLTKDAATEGFENAASDFGLPMSMVDVAEHGLRDIYAADLALLRPDQVVAWRGNAVPSDVHGVLETVTGKHI